MNPPIKIQIEDGRRFADVAFLLDRDDFLKDVVKIRKSSGLAVQTYDSSKHWTDDRWNTPIEARLKHSEATQELENQLQDLNYMLDLSIEEKIDVLEKFRKADRILPENAFRQDIQRIRKKYKKAPNFDRIIAHAVLYGEVRDEDYITCDIEIDRPEVDIVDYDREARVVVVIYPNVKPIDVAKIIQEKSEKVFKEYQEKWLRGSLVNYDTRGNIKRDRKWYWMNKSGRGYTKISKHAETEGVSISWSGVREALNAYRGMLTLKI